MFTLSSQGCAPISLGLHLLTISRALAPRLQLGPALVHLREGDGRNAEQIAFHGRAHGARVNRVVAHVGAVVDARDHQIGR
jgi:hypothetical protein